jgi:hypothetical protein
MFENERFYWAEDNNLLGRECHQAMVAAINDVVYKISFAFYISDQHLSNSFRRRVHKYLTTHLGPGFERHRVGYHELLVWDAPEGNVILELAASHETDIILTSAILRNAKRISRVKSFLTRVFG